MRALKNRAVARAAMTRSRNSIRLNAMLTCLLPKKKSRVGAKVGVAPRLPSPKLDCGVSYYGWVAFLIDVVTSLTCA